MNNYAHLLNRYRFVEVPHPPGGSVTFGMDIFYRCDICGFIMYSGGGFLPDAGEGDIGRCDCHNLSLDVGRFNADDIFRMTILRCTGEPLTPDFPVVPATQNYFCYRPTETYE